MSQSKVTELVERCTAATLKQPDTEVTQQLVEEIKKTPRSKQPPNTFYLFSAKAFASSIRERLLTNQSKVMWLSLGLLDFAMDKASNNLCNQVANQEFMQTLIQILNAKEVHLEVSFLLFANF